MDKEKEKQIDEAERALDRAFDQVLELLNRARWLRAEVTDPGAIRRGWGLDKDMDEFHAMAGMVVYALKCNATEFGGGPTTELAALLVRLQEAVKVE